ncbi:hypothetical protein ACHAXT_001066 [Thalassiosira profunda]
MPPRKFTIVPKGLDARSREEQTRIGSKQEYFKVLSELVGRDVAIQDADTKKYLCLGTRKANAKDATYNSLFGDEPQYLCLNRTDRGSFTFGAKSKVLKRRMFLHKSDKAVGQEMRAASGKVESIDLCPVTFSSNTDTERNANEWVAEPDLVLERRENCLGSILYLGIVGINKAQGDVLLASHHFQNTCTAWRTSEQFGAIVCSLKTQIKQVGGNDKVAVHEDYTGNKTKWFAKMHCAKLCVVATSSNFLPELAEECVDGMTEMVARNEVGVPSKNELWKIGVDVQIKGVELAAATATEKEEEETREDVEETENTLSQSLKGIPVSCFLDARAQSFYGLDEDTRTRINGGRDARMSEEIMKMTVKEKVEKARRSISRAAWRKARVTRASF